MDAYGILHGWMIIKYSVSRLVRDPDGHRVFLTERGSVFVALREVGSEESHRYIRGRIADRHPGWVVCGYRCGKVLDGRRQNGYERTSTP